MSWDKTPPSKEELEFSNPSAWDSSPPSKAELSLAEKSSPLMSGVRKFVQGASAGLSDELAGGLEAGGRAFGLSGVGGPIKDISFSDSGPSLDLETLKKAYEEGRNFEREALKKDARDNPVISGVAELGGAIASPINKILPANVSAAKSGAAIGGAYGLGSSEADNGLDLVKDTALGAGLGLGAGFAVDKVVAPGLQKVQKFAGEKLKDLAESQAARAVGAERGSIKALGKGSPTVGKEKVREVGRQVLDEGIITPLNSTDDMISRNKELMTGAMDARKAAYSQIDEAGASKFNPLDVASKIDEEVGTFNKLSPLNEPKTKHLESTLESVLQRGDKNISMREAQELIEELGSAAKWSGVGKRTPKEELAQEIYILGRKFLNEAAKDGADSVGTEGLKKIIETANRKYHVGENTKTLLNNKFAREQGNKMFGLTDAVMGAGGLGYGATTGDWETAAGIMVAKKGAERFGNQMTAKGADAVSKMLLKSPRFGSLAQSNPKAFQALVQQIESRINGPRNLQFPKAADQNSDVADSQYRDPKQSFLDGN